MLCIFPSTAGQGYFGPLTSQLLSILANAADYRQWPHPSTREMVQLLSMDTTAGTILFRRQLPQRMLLIDHILRSNMFPLQHIVQMRGAILEALYRISEGYWFIPADLIMTALFPDEPRLERRRGCEATLTVDRWQAMPRAFHLPPLGPDEDQPTAEIPLEDLPPVAEHTEEPPAPSPSVPASVPPAPPTTAPIPSAPVSSIPSEPSAPMPTAHSDISGPITSAPPQQYITISIRDFLTIMEAVRTFSTTAASFAASHATLAYRMARIEAAMAQTSAILAQDKAILMQLQSHMGLPVVSPYVLAQAYATPPPAGSAPPPLAPADPLDVLAAAAASTTPPATPQPV